MLAIFTSLIVIFVGITLWQTSDSAPWAKSSVSTNPPWLHQPIEADGNEFVIPLKTGDRVEIEVSNASGISTLKDPFGNIIMQSATKVEYYKESNPMYELGRLLSGHSSTPIISPHIVSTQEYPWRFAFIAASSGNYLLKTSGMKDSPAHIKVTINP
jgi:hypothetical protein